MADRAPSGRRRGDWLGELPFRTIVLHRTVGLFRNLAETVFPERATPAGLAGARDRLFEALSSAASASRRRFGCRLHDCHCCGYRLQNFRGWRC